MKEYCLEVREKVPSKKNSYEVRFNGSLWKSIKPIVAAFRRYKRKTYWIDTSDAVKQFEEVVAWTAKAKLPELKGDLELTVEFRGRIDTDNSPGAICDGLERSGRIANDAQFKVVKVIHLGGPGKGCRLRIRELSEDPPG